jgi:hypothetical protein
VNTRRAIETTVLLWIGVLLAVAVTHDVYQQTNVNHRLDADLASWRAYTGHDYHNLSTDRDLKTHSTRDVICGNTSPGAPHTRTQLCLIMTGPVVHGRRAIHGGYYLPPNLIFDVPAKRYGCFGEALAQGLCARH